jgi:hypothetical protein
MARTTAPKIDEDRERRLQDGGFEAGFVDMNRFVHGRFGSTWIGPSPSGCSKKSGTPDGKHRPKDARNQPATSR